MKKIIRMGALAVAGLLMLSGNQALAQQERGGRGNFDPEQMRERMMERVREQLEVKDDAEWKLIQARVIKVMEARREVGGGGGGAFFGRQGGPGGPGAPGGGRDGGRGGNRGTANPEAEALQKAIESKASAEEVKAKLAQFRAARQAREDTLAKAREELKQVLSARQEAMAVLTGWLE